MWSLEMGVLPDTPSFGGFIRVTCGRDLVRVWEFAVPVEMQDSMFRCGYPGAMALPCTARRHGYTCEPEHVGRVSTISCTYGILSIEGFVDMQG